MATITLKIGPADAGRAMSLTEFIEADFEDGWLYELSRGVIVVTEVPGINHGRIVRRLAWLFLDYNATHPGIINYSAGGGECRLRLPGMVCDRHPDQAVYLLPPPPGRRPWTRWVPQIVVEVVSEGSEERDLVEKREEYLRAGVTEYWILEPATRKMTALCRAGDTWEENVVPTGGTHRTHLLPGLEVCPDDLFGPIDAAGNSE